MFNPNDPLTDPSARGTTFTANAAVAGRGGEQELAARARKIIDDYLNRRPGFYPADNTGPAQPPSFQDADQARDLLDYLEKGVKPAGRVALNMGDGTIAIYDPNTDKLRFEQNPVMGPDPKSGETVARTGLLQAQTQAQLAGIPTAEERQADVRRDNAAAGASEAQTRLTNAQLANLRTPEQESQLRIQESIARARAESQAIFERMQQMKDAGLIMPEEAAKRLDSELRVIDAKLQGEIERENAAFASTLRREEATETFEREQPYKDRAEQRADAQLTETRLAREENDRIQRQQAEQTRRRDLASTLTTQAQQGQTMLDRVVKAGVRPSMATLRLALDPLQFALQLQGKPYEEVPQAPPPLQAGQAPPPLPGRPV